MSSGQNPMNVLDEKSKFKTIRRSRLAVVSLILGLLSILLPIPVVALILHPLTFGELLARDLFWLLPFVAFVVGVLALYRIGKAKELLKGKICASIGIFLSALPLLISLFIISSDIGSYAKSKITTIDNVTKETTVLLLSDEDKQKSVCSLQVYISGYIDGAATISIYEDEHNEHEYQIPNGKVCIKRGGDWYNNKCLIKYTPINVNSGHLKIRYYFGTI